MGSYELTAGKGSSVTAPAGISARVLVVHAGGWNSAGKLTAHLADGSAADFVDTSTAASGQYDRNYTLTYRANSNTTLTVTWVMASGGGNVTLNGAALAGSTMAGSGGTGQSAAVTTAFASPLQATVSDAGGNPLGGVSVTFTAPGSGASATFGGLATATVTTGANGVAVSPVVTANAQAGTYTVTATSAVGGAVSYSLTNTAGSAASVTATGGTPQAAAVNTMFATPLQATVSDGNGRRPASA